MSKKITSIPFQLYFLIRIIDNYPEMLDIQKPEAQIAVDGGVTVDNIGELYQAGANFFVAGSSVFRADDIAAAIGNLRDACA